MNFDLSLNALAVLLGKESLRKRHIRIAARYQAQKRPAKQDRAIQDVSLERSFEVGNGAGIIAKASEVLSLQT
jgi:hypothetical protein